MLNLLGYIPARLQILTAIFVVLVLFQSGVEIFALYTLFTLVKISTIDQASYDRFASFYEFVTDKLPFIQIIDLIVFISAIFVFKALLQLVCNIAVYYLALSYRKTIQLALITKMLRSVDSKGKDQTDALWTRSLINDTVVLEGRILTPLFVTFSELVPMLAVFWYLSTLNISLVAFFALTLGAFGLVIYISSRTFLFSIGVKQLVEEERLLSFLQSIHLTKREIYYYDHVQATITKSERMLSKLFRYLFLGLSAAILPRHLLEGMFFVLVLTLSILIGFESDWIEVDGVQLIVVIAGILRLIPSISKLISHLQSFKHGHGVLKSLNKVLGAVVEKKKSPTIVFDRQNYILNFSNLNFKNSNKHLFRNINISLKSGSWVAVVGASGSGKSTLINCLLGFKNFTNGSISLNKRQIESLYEIRHVVGYVPQKSSVFAGSLRENLFLSEEDQVGELRAIRALEAMNVPSQLLNLDFEIHENGSNLSGGQIQRVAIARAIIRNPQIFVLDEATSALDTKTQTALLDFIACNYKNSSLIMVTHREEVLHRFPTVIEL